MDTLGEGKHSIGWGILFSSQSSEYFIKDVKEVLDLLDEWKLHTDDDEQDIYLTKIEKVIIYILVKP